MNTVSEAYLAGNGVHTHIAVAQQLLCCFNLDTPNLCERGSSDGVFEPLFQIAA